MTPEAEAVVHAWRRAAADLDVDVTAPWALGGDGGSAEVLALVVGFGQRTGTVVALTTDPRVRELEGAASRLGVSLSLLDAEAYRRYDRELFVDTLNDWGWKGEGDPPDWYGGHPWGE